jgi:hypothetical protein
MLNNVIYRTAAVVEPSHRRVFLAALVLALAVFAGAFQTTREASAAHPPIWVNDMLYGSSGAGFYWDPATNQVWTGERGWHAFSPVPYRAEVAPLWVNYLDYGSAGGGFFLDPRSGMVWTGERGWHYFSPQYVPDSDGDGLPDNVDRCPRAYGPPGNIGCPVSGPVDTDGDGILDDQDGCPTTPGVRGHNGCPPPPANPSPNPTRDRDGDGVPDDQDWCPETWGAGPDRPGCPPFPKVDIWVDRGDGSTYYVGDPIRVCYSVNMPMHIEIIDETPDGRTITLLEGQDDGTGGCFDGIVTEPLGTEVLRIYGPMYSAPCGPGSFPGCHGDAIAMDSTHFVIKARSTSTTFTRIVDGMEHNLLDTGIDIPAGATVTITGSGGVRFGTGGTYDGPAGGCSDPGIYPGTRCHALIGKIGAGSPFTIGASLSFVAGSGGRLYLGINDSMYTDNGGSFTVTVTITK